MIIRRLGRADYEPTWRAMQAFTTGRTEDTPDELWLVEHPPVYTVGVAGRSAHLPRVDNGIPVVFVDRGGQITYHGPGQAVVYTLVDLARRGLSVRAFVRMLESAVIDLLGRHRLEAHHRAEAPGVYVAGAKVAALGLRVRKGRCYHGLALNVDMDLAPFLAIDPCGHAGMPVTCLRDLRIDVSLFDAAEALAGAFLDRLCAAAR